MNTLFILPEPTQFPFLLLLEHRHIPFELWLANMIRAGELSETDNFRIIDLRHQYLAQCWKDETLWAKNKESSDVQR